MIQSYRINEAMNRKVPKALSHRLGRWDRIRNTGLCLEGCTLRNHHSAVVMRMLAGGTEV